MTNWTNFNQVSHLYLFANRDEAELSKVITMNQKTHLSSLFVLTLILKAYAS